MATVQITTWDEFKTALTETVTEATTYEIMNDIDVSGEILTSTISIPYNSTYTKIFKPTEGITTVKINGITSYSSVVIFTLGGGGTSSTTAVAFNNIHFSNIMANNATLFQGVFFSGSNHYRFNNCLFSGIIRTFANNNNSMNSGAVEYTNMNFQNCSFNISCNYFCYSGSYTGYYIYFSNCYIIFYNTAI